MGGAACVFLARTEFSPPPFVLFLSDTVASAFLGGETGTSTGVSRASSRGQGIGGALPTRGRSPGKVGLVTATAAPEGSVLPLWSPGDFRKMRTGSFAAVAVKGRCS